MFSSLFVKVKNQNILRQIHPSSCRKKDAFASKVKNIWNTYTSTILIYSPILGCRQESDKLTKSVLIYEEMNKM